jgi:hypothetical protein
MGGGYRAAFQSGYLFAQRKKPLARHGRLRHDVTPIADCSCYVLIDSRGAGKSQRQILRINSLTGRIQIQPSKKVGELTISRGS